MPLLVSHGHQDLQHGIQSFNHFIHVAIPEGDLEPARIKEVFCAFVNCERVCSDFS